MLFCAKCRKEVLIYGICMFPGADEAAAGMSDHARNEGKLVLFNPPPFEPYNCPACGKALVDHEPETLRNTK